MRRRVLITIAATAALLLVAAVSLAAWLSLRETEPSSFTAASASIRVDIGNAETVALFDLVDMEPGDTATACLRAAIDLDLPVTVAKLYSSGASGSGLADYLTINIEREDPVAPSAAIPGLINCAEVTGTLTALTVGSPALTSYASLYSSYAAGASLGTLTGKAINTVDLKIVMTLPLSTPPAASGLNATTSWIVEDQ